MNLLKQLWYAIRLPVLIYECVPQRGSKSALTRCFDDGIIMMMTPHILTRIDIFNYFKHYF